MTTADIAMQRANLLIKLRWKNILKYAPGYGFQAGITNDDTRKYYTELFPALKRCKND